MPRYLFTHLGEAPMPAEHLERLATLGKMVDRAGRTILVETEAALAPEVATPPGWVCEPEHFIPVPDPRKSIQKPSAG